MNCLLSLRLRVRKVSQQESELVNWAYEVIDVVREAYLKAEGDPIAVMDVTKEVMAKLPDLIEAFMVLVAPEHRRIVGRLINDIIRVVRSCR